ncbi:Acetyl-CoA acetyltransferase [Sphingobacterium daejeonense]|nr:Acetyl-CoA acetyltransferase [Sphingobacterium daejeonense]
MSKKVYIVAAKRTPMGSFGSSLASVSATELGAKAIKAVLEEVKLELHQVDEVYMGSVLQANLGKHLQGKHQNMQDFLTAYLQQP